MEQFDEDNRGLIVEVARLHVALRDAFAELPALPIAISLMDAGTLHDATRDMAEAARALSDLPGHPVFIQGLMQAACHWIAGVYCGLVFADSGAEGAFLAASFSLQAAEQDIELATWAAQGRIPDHPEIIDMTDESDSDEG